MVEDMNSKRIERELRENYTLYLYIKSEKNGRRDE